MGGGDGWTSPLGAYACAPQITMDASGSVASITIRFDERFESILVVAQSVITGIVGLSDTQMNLIQKEPDPAGIRARAMGEGIQTGINDQCVFAWSPPLIISQDRYVCTTDNVDGGLLNSLAWIFCFNIRVYEKIPLNVILASIPSRETQNVVV